MYTRRPGECDVMCCPTCGAECTVERNIEDYVGDGCLKTKMRCDRFKCGWENEPWHDTVRELLKEYFATKSKKLRALIGEDIYDELDPYGLVVPFEVN